MSNPNTRKSCAVPKCKNTTNNSPEKLFFHVPMNVQMRKKWIKAMKRLHPFASKTTAYCCEDHFDIENDMESYVKYKLVGGRLKLKEGTVPHKFKCQQDKDDKKERSAVQKRDRIKYFERLLGEHGDLIPSTTKSPEKIGEVYVTGCEIEAASEDPLRIDNNDQCLAKFIQHKSVQVKLKDKVVHKHTMTEEKYFKEKKQPSSRKDKDRETFYYMTDTSSNISTHEMYNLNHETNSSDTDSSECEKQHFKNHMQRSAQLCISREPQLLLGLPKHCYFTINILSESTKLMPRNIMVALKKIRLHQPNAILALDFGLSTSYVTKIIRDTTPAKASVMKQLVYFPQSANVSLNVAIPFRKNFSHVQSIIDCFEIQIEKPVDAVKQALTWSDYKGCNTIKYLISITPDGLINFVSEGYGGRATDSLIFGDCGILQALPDGVAVLADRGFKNIAHLLQQNRNILIRPPSVSAQVKPTKKEVLDTKKIAALRIHVERAIGRLRAFGFMLPHACVDIKHVDMLDSVVFAACGIVNLQSSLFNLE